MMKLPIILNILITAYAVNFRFKLKCFRRQCQQN